MTLTISLPIVKVELSAIHPDADALICDQEGRRQTRKLDREEQYQVRGRSWAYFHAWWSDATGWVLIERCADQSW